MFSQQNDFMNHLPVEGSRALSGTAGAVDVGEQRLDNVWVTSRSREISGLIPPFYGMEIARGAAPLCPGVMETFNLQSFQSRVSCLAPSGDGKSRIIHICYIRVFFLLLRVFETLDWKWNVFFLFLSMQTNELTQLEYINV